MRDLYVFALGGLFGAVCMFIFAWYWIIRPMGRLLGFEDTADTEDAA